MPGVDSPSNALLETVSSTASVISLSLSAVPVDGEYHVIDGVFLIRVEKRFSKLFISSVDGINLIYDCPTVVTVPIAVVKL